MSNFNEEKQAMQVLTQKYMDKLTDIWEQTFPPETYKKNLRKFFDDASHFYDEIINEALSSKAFIANEINDLKIEARNLILLLKADVNLPSYETNEVPLQMVQFDWNKSVAYLREQLKLRKKEICDLLLEQGALCEELGLSPRILLYDPLPTAEEIENFRKYLGTLRDERAERMRREVKHFLQILDLQIPKGRDYQLLNQRQIKINTETFEVLMRMHNSYGSQVRELREKIQRMREKLDTLWDHLKTSPTTRNKFNLCNDYNQHTYDVFYSELQRCESLKKIRHDIENFWEKTLKSEKQKISFSKFASTCYKDDLIALHETDLENLKLYYETNKQIFELYADRNILWERMNALESKASDPGRYNNRGGQLLNEEKERKIIAKTLPKIEQRITELVKKYEEREQVPFLVYGQNIIDVMVAQWEQKIREKELLQLARKNSRKTTPHKASKTSSTMRSPLSAKKTSPLSSLQQSSAFSLNCNTLSTEKRKLSSADRHTTMVKRSLIQALGSPSLFQKPCTTSSESEYATVSSTHSATKKHKKSESNLKSSLKRSTKIIATTIRRRSGRYSSGLKKRRSLKIPKIVISNCQSDGYSTDYNSDDTYNSFKKCIEPAKRPLILQNVTNRRNSSHSKRIQKIVDENTKLMELPRPPAINRTPTKQDSNFSNHTRTIPHDNHNSPAACSNKRKLATKNLPIII